MSGSGVVREWGVGTSALLEQGGNEEKTDRWTQGWKAGIRWSQLSDRETAAPQKYSMKQGSSV